MRSRKMSRCSKGGCKGTKSVYFLSDANVVVLSQLSKMVAAINELGEKFVAVNTHPHYLNKKIGETSVGRAAGAT